MSKKQYNIIYYHGLDGSLSDEKRKIMEPFGKVTAPTYDYRNPETLQKIRIAFDETVENTVVIGSSFGGYLANMFSIAYDLPCLLFNPALPYRSIDLNLAEPFDYNIQSLSYVVLGRLDDTIQCGDNLAFINQYFKGPKEVIIEETMAHRIPNDIFEKHVKRFFKETINK